MNNGQLREAIESKLRPGAGYTSQDVTAFALGVEWAMAQQVWPVLAEVQTERERQDGKWGGPLSDDARKSPADWVLDIEAYVTWACQMHRMGDQGKYRRRVMQVAALAVAACESYDRSKTPNVRAERATTAGRQARAGENVPRTARPGLVACRWRSA